MKIEETDLPGWDFKKHEPLPDPILAKLEKDGSLKSVEASLPQYSPPGICGPAIWEESVDIGEDENEL